MKLMRALGCVLCFAAGASAQTIRGVVVELETRTPLAGAFIVLRDSAGQQRGATLSDSLGRFYLRAPYLGSFSLRAELIGHESRTARVRTSADAQAVTLALPIAAVQLAELKVSSGKVCSGRPDALRETAQVWEEIRKALTVASWLERENPIHFEVRKFERILHPRTGALMREAVTTSRSLGRPYAAVSADSLMQYGFVRSYAADSVLFFGPDADVLLSHAFLDTHCFWLKRGERDRQGLIGLAFEPIPKRELRDVAGTLWVDLRSRELKFVEYRFTKLGPELDVRGVGGRTDFRRIPNGAWIVDRWFIRMPGGVSSPHGFVVNGLVESGGEIVSAKTPGARDIAINKTRITGFVFDSVAGKPLLNAMVYLSGTPHRAMTDSAGHFEIADLNEGHYTIAFAHAAFDSLPSLPEAKAVTAASAQPVHIELAIPSASALRASTCGSDTAGGVLTGFVWGRDSNGVAGQVVRISWTMQGNQLEKLAVTDRAGRFVRCGLPVDWHLRIKTAQAIDVMARIGSARFARKDINLGGPE